MYWAHPVLRREGRRIFNAQVTGRLAIRRRFKSTPSSSLEKGWTAALGSSGIFTPEALFLALTLYTWQMHHFMTIAWTSRTDYMRAGFIMQSLDDPEGYKTARKGLFWALSMVPLPFLSTALHFTNPMFMITGTAINAYLVREYYRFYRTRTIKDAKRARYAGFLQLLVLFGLMTFHLESRDHIKAFQQLNQLRHEGLNYCVYHYHKIMNSSHLCVYLFGKSKQNVQDNDQRGAEDKSPTSTQLEERSASNTEATS